MSSGNPSITADELRLDAIERVVTTALRSGHPDRVLAVAVVDASSPLAEFGRAMEAARFPEYDMAKAMAPWDDVSFFFYTVDVEHGRIGHVKRMVRARSAAEIARTGRTGIEVIDDRLDATDPAEQATLESLLAQFDITDPATMWNIATSCATERIAPTRSGPYSLLTYKALFLLSVPLPANHFYAYINRKTVRAMARIGIPCTVVGDHEFHLPTPHGYDQDYVAVHITADDETVRAFTVVDPARPLSRAVAECDLEMVVLLDHPDQVLDLTDAAVAPYVEVVAVDSSWLAADDVVIDLTDDDRLIIDLTDAAMARAQHG